MEKFNLTQSKRGYLLRISASDACNFNCAFCRPEKKVLDDVLSDDELIRIVKEINNQYVLKTVHFTGGEPLLRKNIVNIIRECKEIVSSDVEIVMTTNGLLLGDKVEELTNAGLSRVNISLHTLNQARYSKITGTSCDIDVIKNAIAKSRKAGLQVKTNSVLIRNLNDVDIFDVMNYCFDLDVIPRFLELGLYGPVANWFSPKDTIMRDEIIEIIEQKYGTVKSDLRYRGNGPTKYYRTSDGKVFGIVDHQSNKLCVGCDRFRLSSNGKIRVCNFDYVDLRGALGSEEELKNMIHNLKEPLMVRGCDYIGKRVHKIDYNFRWNINGI